MACNLQRLTLCVSRGDTIALPIRIESSTLGYAAISAIANSAPVTITAPAHGLTEGWRAAVANAGGMTQINYPGSELGRPPRDRDMRPVVVVSDSVVQFNDINAAAFGAYASGGQLVFYAPLALSGYASARMQVNSGDGEQLALFTTANGGLEIDAAAQALWLRIAAEDSAAIEWESGFFDIELVTAGGEVRKVCAPDSVITVAPEQTTDHA